MAASVIVSITAFEVEQHLVLTGVGDDGQSVPPEVCAAFFAVPAKAVGSANSPSEMRSHFDELLDGETERLLASNEERNLRYFSDEEEKLDPLRFSKLHFANVARNCVRA